MYEDFGRLVQPTMIFTRLCNGGSSNLFNILSSFIFEVPLFIYFYFEESPTVLLLHDITAFSFVLFWLFIFIQHSTLVFSPLLKKDMLTQFFSAMEKVQQTLHILNIRQPPEPTKTSQISWVVLFSLLNVVPVTYYILVGKTWLAFFALLYFTVLLGFYARLRVLLDVVSGTLGLLNWHLDDLNNRWPLFLPRPPDVTFSDLSCVAAWRRTKFVCYHSHVRRLTPYKIRAFNKAHYEICHAYKLLDAMFSLDLLAVTLSTGVSIVVCFFSMFNKASKSTYTMKIGWMIFTVSLVTPLVVTLTYSSKVKEKCRKTALLVHDLLDEDGHTEEVDDELEEFSKALLHRSMTLSAGGFFIYDLKLVSKMASIIAPIALFLIQNNNRIRSKTSQHKD